MSPWSCVLFFPGSEPELYAKAVATGVDRVCLDLEDAVAADAKSDARAAASELLSSGGSEGLIVRINHPASDEGRHDLDVIAGLDPAPGPITLMVPKVDSANDAALVRERFEGAGGGGRVAIIPVIETARGLANVEAIAADDGVCAMILGGLDLSIELGCSLEWEALLYARSRCVHAARLADVAMVDTPFFDLEDPEGLRREAERAHALGFTAKAAIHPSQVDTIETVFEPSDEEVERARRVVAAVEDGERGVFVVDGIMVDRPAIQAARRIVARAGSAEADP